MIDINTLRFEVQLNKLDNSQLTVSPLVVEDLLDRIEMAEQERDVLRTHIEEMEKQEPVAFRWELKAGQYTYVDKPEHASKNARIAPLYLAPGAQGEEK